MAVTLQKSQGFHREGIHIGFRNAVLLWQCGMGFGPLHPFRLRTPPVCERQRPPNGCFGRGDASGVAPEALRGRVTISEGQPPIRNSSRITPWRMQWVCFPTFLKAGSRKSNRSNWDSVPSNLKTISTRKPWRHDCLILCAQSIHSHVQLASRTGSTTHPAHGRPIVQCLCPPALSDQMGNLHESRCTWHWAIRRERFWRTDSLMARPGGRPMVTHLLRGTLGPFRLQARSSANTLPVAPRPHSRR